MPSYSFRCRRLLPPSLPSRFFAHLHSLPRSPSALHFFVAALVCAFGTAILHYFGTARFMIRSAPRTLAFEAVPFLILCALALSTSLCPLPSPLPLCRFPFVCSFGPFGATRPRWNRSAMSSREVALCEHESVSHIVLKPENDLS